METTSAKVSVEEFIEDINKLVEFVNITTEFVTSDEDMKRAGTEGSSFLKIMTEKSATWLKRYTDIVESCDFANPEETDRQFVFLTNKQNEDRIEIMRNLDDTREFFAQNYNICTYLN